MEPRLKLGTVIRLHDVDSERQAVQDVVDESNGGGLIARIIELEDPDPCAIVNRGELEEAFPRARNPLQKLHVQL